MLSGINLKKASGRLILWLACSICGVCNATGQNVHPANALAALQLQTVDGSTADLGITEEFETVYVFLSPECPICQQCTLTIKELVKVYRSKGIVFYGVMPGTMYSNQELRDFEKKYKLNFPLLADPDYKLTGSLHATITPQVFVLNKAHEIVYSGAVDNAYLGLGRKSAHTTAHYLSDALAAMTANKTVALSTTSPVGCLIEGIKVSKK